MLDFVGDFPTICIEQFISLSPLQKVQVLVANQNSKIVNDQLNV